MKTKIHPRLIQYGIASSFLMLTTMSHAVTTLVSPSRYSVTEGVAFTLGNNGAADFLFNWTDPSGAPPLSFSNIADPTLILTLGQTYTFQRTTGAHPFAIMNNTAAAFMSGADGTYSRTTTSSTDINNATLTPIAAFTADPAPTTDLISWTPSQVGDFWYTCTVTSHPGMSGKITVIPEPSAFGLIAGGFAFAAFRRRRSFGRYSDK
jgi:plastocyanin